MALILHSNDFVDIALWILLHSYVTQAGIPTYLMMDYCDKDINMIVLNINAGRLLLARDRNNARDCAVTIASWYTTPYIQIQFEGLTLKDRYLTLMDGGENSETVSGLPRYIVGTEALKGLYSTSTRFLRVYLSQFLFGDDEDHSEFSLVFNSFDKGSCSSAEYECANGRCISKELLCNGYNPCGDSSDCVLSKAVIASIVVSSVVAFGVTVTITVCLVLRKRKKIRRPNGNEQQQRTINSSDRATLAHDGQVDSPPSYFQVMSSPDLYMLQKTSTYSEPLQINLDHSSTV